MLLAVVTLTAAGYAHLQLPRFVATRAGLTAARGVLFVVGLGFGYVSAMTYAGGSLRWLGFLVGFGAVHVPAALILLIKRARGAPRT